MDIQKDFFISYNKADRSWAEWIAWTLEESGYSVVIQAWDFRPGGNFVLEMQRAAKEAQKTIAVLSEDYLKSSFTQPEWAAAFAQDPQGQKGTLIPVRVQPCKLTGLLAPIIYVDLLNLDAEAAQETLLKALEERAKPLKKPQFPGTSDRVIPTQAIFPGHSNIPQNLPRSGVVKFIGREQKLLDLHTQLQQNDRIAITAIAGMGGIGKTELALQYAIAQLQHQTYPAGLCWLTCRAQEIATQIVSFAKTKLLLTIPDDLEAKEQVDLIWRCWPEGNALIVLDDVTDYTAISLYLPPPDPRFKVLITTRQNFGASVTTINIEELSDEATIALLKSIVGNERIEAQRGEAQALCKWVGNLPLGLELLGRFLVGKPDWAIAKLLERLETKRLAAKALIETESGMTATLGVAAALELSWAELSQPQQDLACLLGMFVVAPIPWSLVEPCFPEIDSDDLEDLRDEGLRDRSLLKRVGEGTYQLHQIVREYFRWKVLNLNKLNQLYTRITKSLKNITKEDLFLAINILYSIDINEFYYTAKQNILSPIEYGHVLREAYEAWVQGLGVISNLIAPLQDNGKLAQLQIQYLEEDIPEDFKVDDKSKYRCMANIKTCWYYGDDLPNDVIEFEGTPKAARNSVWRKVTERKYPIINHPYLQSLEAYRMSLDSLVGNLSDCINQRKILIYEGVMAEENIWRSAYFLTQRYWRYPGVMHLDSISIPEINSYLETYKSESDILSKSVNIPSFKQLLFKLKEIQNTGYLKINYPWTSHYIFEPEMALTRAHDIYMAALEAYRLIINTWFPELSNNLYLFNLMPVKISGFILDDSKMNHKNITGYSASASDATMMSLPNYFVSWFWDVLPSGSQNRLN